MTIFNKEDIQKLIDNEVEESTILEYKASFATQSPKWKEELAKDVSAMANSNGGIETWIKRLLYITAQSRS